MKRVLSVKRSALLLAVFSPLALSLAGCDGSTDGSGGSGGGGGGGGDNSPLYAIGTIVFSPDLSSRTEHIAFSDSLAGDGTIDPSKAIEIKAENSSIWQSPNKDEFFLVDAGTGSIIKYGPASGGAVEEKGKIGFSAYGVNAAYWTLLVFASPTKAYMFDEITLKVFVWNPTEMTISKEIDVASQFNTDEGGKKFTVWRERRPLQIGDKFYAAFKYYDPPSAVSLPRSGMMIFDSNNDDVVIVEKPDCTGLHNSVRGSDGKIYSSTGVVAAAAYFVGQPEATTPCIARFDPDTWTWDDTFNVDISAIAGGLKAAGGLHSHLDGPVYIRVLNEEQATVLGFTNPLQLAGAPLWDTFKIDDITNPTAATKVGSPSAGGLLYPFTLDEKTYVSDVNLGAGKSWFVDLTQDPPDRTLQMEGWGYYAVRVR